MVNGARVRRLVLIMLLAGALVVDLLVIRSLVDVAIGSAACIEAANYLLISCVGPPSEWQFILTTMIAVGLAVSIGIRLAAWTRTPEPGPTLQAH